MSSVLILSVVLSFCSLTYELLLAKSFSLITDNVVLAQTVSIGVYLLGIGVGVYRTGRGSRLSFSSIETVLSFLGILIAIFSYSVNSFIDVFLVPHMAQVFWIKVLFFSSWALLIGYFTGGEFIYLVKKGEAVGMSLNTVLAATYFGNLFGGLAFPLFLYEPLGLIGTCIFIASLNLAVAFYLLNRVYSLSGFVAMVCVALLLSVFSIKKEAVSNGLKSLSYTNVSTPDFSFITFKNLWHFFKKEAPTVESFRSKYQDIDLVTYGDRDTTLFLNRKPQFSTKNYKSYHISMLEGFINLHGGLPEEVLILGGGDGILARYLLEKNVKSVKIIDLDPFITYLAKNHEAFLGLNSGSLLSPKVEVVNGDAFTFMMKNKKKYDAIFIDFPLPTHLDLSKLYSTEFYKKVYGSLTEKGSAIFDSPANLKFKYGAESLKSSSLDLINKTIQDAGIDNYFTYGPYEAFGFFTKQQKVPSFDYEALPHTLESFVLMNLIDLETFIDVRPGVAGNSIFRPRRFK